MVSSDETLRFRVMSAVAVAVRFKALNVTATVIGRRVLPSGVKLVRHLIIKKEMN